MPFLQILLLFSSTLTLIAGFSCKSINYEDYCESINSCKWEKNKCIGSIEHTCNSDSCYYIYQSSNYSDPDGSLEHPFTLMEQLKEKVPLDTNYTLYGINLPGEVIQAISNTHIGSQTVTIRPFFKFSKLQMFATNGFVLKEESSILNIRDTTIHVKSNMNTFIDDFYFRNKSCNLNFKDVNFNISKMKVSSQVISMDSCNLNMTNVQISGNRPQIYVGNSSAKLDNTVRNKVYIKGLNISVEDDQAYQIFRFENSEIDIRDSEFVDINTNIKQLEPIFYAVGGYIHAKNISFRNVSQSIFRYYGSKFDIIKCKFIGINASNLIEARGPLHSESLISDSIFKDVLVSKNAIFTGLGTQFINITMKNIYYLPMSSQDFFLNSNNGICIYAFGQPISILRSTFSNFSSSCVLANNIGLKIQNSLFYLPPFKDKYRYDEFLNCIVFHTTTLLFENYIDYDSRIAEISDTIFHSDRNDQKIVNAIFNIFSKEGSALFIQEPFYQIDSGSFSIRDSLFNNCSASTTGGAISAQGYQLSPYSIIQSIFTHNIAGTTGGAVSVSKTQLIISESVFHDNRAKYGGAIASLIPTLSISDTFIFQNVATQRGGGILQSDSANKTLANVSISQNFDARGLSNISIIKLDKWVLRLHTFESSLTQFPQKGNQGRNFSAMLNSKISKLHAVYTKENISELTLNVTPGYPFPYILEGKFYDKDEQVSTYIDNYEFIGKYQGPFEDKRDTKTTSKNGTFYFYDEIKLSGFGDTLPYTIKSDTLKQNLLSQLKEDFNITFNVYTSFCKWGDKIISPESCLPCPEDLYSLQYPTVQAFCERCPDNLQCLGGDLIVPMKGFYRFDNKSVSAIECLNKDACIGGIDENARLSTNGFCKPPFRGHLCSECNTGYVSSRTNTECIECTFTFWFYFRLAAKFIFTIVIVLFGVSTKIQQGKAYKEAYMNEDLDKLEELKRKFDVSTAIKLIVTFMQMLTIIKTVNYNWKDELLAFYNISSQILPYMIQTFSSKCLLLKFDFLKENLFYNQFLITAAQPFAFIILLFPIFGFSYLRGTRNKEEFWELIKSSILILFYIQQPTILLEALGLFKCRELGEGEYYLQENLDIKCFTRKYYTWAFGLGLPIFIIWGLVYPFYLFIAVRKKVQEVKRNQLARTELYSKYSFIVAGYSEDRYYWDFLILLRKFLMIIAVISIAQTDQVTQGAFLILIMTFALYLQIKSKAYQNEEVGNLDMMSMISIVVMVFLGIYFKSQSFQIALGGISSNKVLVIILTIVGIFLVLNCVFRFAVLMYKGYVDSVRRGVKSIGKALKSKKNNQSTEMTTDINFRDSKFSNPL